MRCRGCGRRRVAELPAEVAVSAFGLKGVQRALWGAFTDRHAVLAVAASRHEEHAKALLGDSRAIVTSNRWWACQSHLHATSPRTPTA